MTTNAMRILTQAKIPFKAFEYKFDENDLAGTHAADFLKIRYCEFYKTLVLKGNKNGIFVCCVPVDCEIDLKKAAQCTNNKSVEMIAVKDLLAQAGYMRGACTPIGMKKSFPVYISNKINELDFVFISGGARGIALKLSPESLVKYTKAVLCDILK